MTVSWNPGIAFVTAAHPLFVTSRCEAQVVRMIPPPARGCPRQPASQGRMRMRAKPRQWRGAQVVG